MGKWVLTMFAVLLLSGCSIPVEGPGSGWRAIESPREGLECWVRGYGNAIVAVCSEGKR
jgi:hypothetical protein